MEEVTKVEDKHVQIKKILMSHVGRKNAITASSISKQLNLPMEDTQVVTRRLIWDTAAVYQIPVVAYGRGFYIAEDEADIEAYEANISARISGMQQNIDMVRNNWTAYREREIGE